MKIAKSLNVNLEYLLDLPNSENTNNLKINNDTYTAIRMYHKYEKFTSALEYLSKYEQETIYNLIEIIISAHNSQ